MAAKADRELSRLRSQNAQLRVDAQRYQKLKRSLSGTGQPYKKPVQHGTPLSQFEIADPRRRPQVGTKVLPPLTPPLTVGKQMAAAISVELKAMAIETRALVKALATMPDANVAMDALSDDTAHRLKALQYKWQKRFENLADLWAYRMIGVVVTQSNAQLNLGLKDIAERSAIQSTMATPRMRAVLEAAAQASVGLITRIPERFLGGVQTAVMTAITTGSGLEQLVPYLTKKYKGDARHAQLVALDQVRKVSESVNATRLQSLGVEEYVWIATGGERYPRKLHHEHLNGKTFRYDDPPIIQYAKGSQPEVRGKPGDLYFCRCRSRPVVNFTKMREVA